MYRLVFGMYSWSAMGCIAQLLGCSDMLHVRNCMVYKIYLVMTRFTPIQAVFKDYTRRAHAQKVPYGTVRYNTVPCRTVPYHNTFKCYKRNGIKYCILSLDIIINMWYIIKYIYALFSYNFFSFAQNCGGSGESVVVAFIKLEIWMVRTFCRFAGSSMITGSNEELNMYCYR